MSCNMYFVFYAFSSYKMIVYLLGARGGMSLVRCQMSRCKIIGGIYPKKSLQDVS